MVNSIESSMEFSIPTIIEKQVHMHPQAKALTLNQTSLTYYEVNKNANQLAHYLKYKGIRSGDYVGICLERSFESVISILAILKLGAAYIPISHQNPAFFIKHIIQIAKPKILITNLQLAEIFSSLQCCYICWETIKNEKNLFPTSNLTGVKFFDHHLAYLIFTSGTTGKPKGVMVTHQNLIATYKSWQLIYQLETEIKSHLQMASFGFDVFTGDLIRALCSGARLVFCPDYIRSDPAKLYELLLLEKIDFAEFVPATLRQLTDYALSMQYQLVFMKLIICGSDNWNMHEFKLVKSITGPSTRLINTYGLTEASIDSTYFEPNKHQLETLPDTLTVPLGRPFPHVELYILDEQLNPVPKGCSGIIFIGGLGVSEGYYQKNKLNNERFISYASSMTKLYNTGDLGLEWENEIVLFLGRVDYQVKINGQRIELNAIESVMRAHVEIDECVVILKNFGENIKRLQAFIVSKNKQLNYSLLKSYASDHLPSYSIPHEFYQIEYCCLTMNGKVDRMATTQLPAICLQPTVIFAQTFLEKELVNIWEDLFLYSNISINYSLDDLGGNSLLLMKLLQIINIRYALNFEPCEITNSITIQQLAMKIHANLSPSYEVKSKCKIS
jgi:amino acid adenylation domain-containing protein